MARNEKELARGTATFGKLEFPTGDGEAPAPAIAEQLKQSLQPAARAAVNAAAARAKQAREVVVAAQKLARDRGIVAVVRGEMEKNPEGGADLRGRLTKLLRDASAAVGKEADDAASRAKVLVAEAKGLAGDEAMDLRRKAGVLERKSEADREAAANYAGAAEALPSAAVDSDDFAHCVEAADEARQRLKLPLSEMLVIDLDPMRWEDSLVDSATPKRAKTFLEEMARVYGIPEDDVAAVGRMMVRLPMKDSLQAFEAVMESNGVGRPSSDVEGPLAFEIKKAKHARDICAAGGELHSDMDNLSLKLNSFMSKMFAASPKDASLPSDISAIVPDLAKRHGDLIERAASTFAERRDLKLPSAADVVLAHAGRQAEAVRKAHEAVRKPQDAVVVAFPKKDGIARQQEIADRWKAEAERPAKLNQTKETLTEEMAKARDEVMESERAKDEVRETFVRQLGMIDGELEAANGELAKLRGNLDTLAAARALYESKDQSDPAVAAKLAEIDALHADAWSSLPKMTVMISGLEAMRDKVKTSLHSMMNGGAPKERAAEENLRAEETKAEEPEAPHDPFARFAPKDEDESKPSPFAGVAEELEMAKVLAFPQPKQRQSASPWSGFASAVDEAAKDLGKGSRQRATDGLLDKVISEGERKLRDKNRMSERSGTHDTTPSGPKLGF